MGLVDQCLLVVKKVFQYVSGIMVLFLIGVVIVDIFGTMFKFPFIYTTEITSLLFPWITGLSGVIIAMDDENIALVLVKEKFQGVARKIVYAVIDLLGITFCCVMCYSSVKMIEDVYTQFTPLFRLSKAIPYSSMTVMFGLSAVVLVIRFIRRLATKDGRIEA